METLPVEVIRLIVDTLTLKEKLQFALVSRTWYRLIRPNGLYSHISARQDISGTWQNLERLKAIDQVKRLTVSYLWKADQFAQKLNQMSNLRHIVWNDASAPLPQKPDMKGVDLNLPHLISIKEFSTPFSLSLLILQHHILHHLTEITYHQPCQHALLLGKNLPELLDLIQVLDKAPQLSQLALAGMIVTIPLLEQISTHAPSIKRLTLSEAIVDSEVLAEPPNVLNQLKQGKFSTGVTLEQLDFVLSLHNLLTLTTAQNLENLTRYMAQKYSRLTKLKVLLDEGDRCNLDDECQTIFINLFTGLPYLKSIHSDLCVYDEAMMASMQHQTLESLTICGDEPSLQNQLDVLAKSESIQEHLQSLTFMNKHLDHVYTTSSIQFSHLANFSCLTTLRIRDAVSAGRFELGFLFEILKIAKGLKVLEMIHCDAGPDIRKLTKFDQALALEELRLPQWSTQTNDEMNFRKGSWVHASEFFGPIKKFYKKLQHIITASPHLRLLKTSLADDIKDFENCGEWIKDDWLLDFKSQPRLRHLSFGFGTKLVIQLKNRKEVNCITFDSTGQRIKPVTDTKPPKKSIHMTIRTDIDFLYINQYFYTFKNKFYLE
ncbi:hypothetical protein A0J61_07567 [Choanephora cucurbitarum]|uniref:F-box domain-containing protein n=1 Tax=Choanephora cucurbitarum TaxID=101091 RepID=A0A1C7N5I0_9FUNG|nr:hypothetical protein A0J61_07567 [Choanephora cucurbitarum]